MKPNWEQSVNTSESTECWSKTGTRTAQFHWKSGKRLKTTELKCFVLSVAPMGVFLLPNKTFQGVFQKTDLTNAELINSEMGNVVTREGSINQACMCKNFEKAPSMELQYYDSSNYSSSKE